MAFTASAQSAQTIFQRRAVANSPLRPAAAVKSIFFATVCKICVPVYGRLYSATGQRAKEQIAVKLRTREEISGAAWVWFWVRSRVCVDIGVGTSVGVWVYVGGVGVDSGLVGVGASVAAVCVRAWLWAWL